IDYRYTEVPTDITVTETEAGLWEDGLDVWFQVDRDDMIQFEDDAVYTVNEESEMEVEDFDAVLVDTDNDGVFDREFSVLGFTVTEESDEEAAVVTINGIELFMQRNIPAGPYDLTMAYAPATGSVYDMQEVFGQDICDHSDCTNDNVGNINDYSDVVHEAFINVVTAGRDQDDASFTTKIVVPVGETTMYAGEKAITLDVPAYINANDYVMLPVRAVATALGISNDAVQWDQATKTVIIMYGQRIITMTAGQKVVYVSGTAIPAKAAVEIVDGRAFLGLRDLATTLGISAINYDATTKTATLN
ncbi:MAG: copper amine oxidase N-terminal domain-containing protein, partial [Anaerotignum sp.]|nr:copper amine oxidase N-terminal domain-containing protein [Anaerotignum sp.]